MSLKDIIPLQFEFSPRLGVRELPEKNGRYETNVKGIYVAGDIADAPIIKAALNQGHHVAEQISNDLKKEGSQNTNTSSGSISDESLLDLVIIGAGPAGIGAGMACKENNLSYLILEKEQPFNTIQNYPKNKLIFSEPRSIKVKANLWFEDAQVEDLIDRWEKELDENSLNIHQPIEVTSVNKEKNNFKIETKNAETDEKKNYQAKKVLVAIGRRGKVRKLGIPGEDSEKVKYALFDPSKYKGKKVLVVGGGDSAVEAACALSQKEADVSISYRQDSFYRAKKDNQDKINKFIDEKKIEAHLKTNPTEIKPNAVTLKSKEKSYEIPNDEVLVFAGTELPKRFLSRLGLRMAGDMNVKRATWVLSFMLLTYLFYVLKSGKPYFPFGQGYFLDFVPGWLYFDIGFRKVSPGFLGTVIYSLLITGFGIRAYLKYQGREQKRRYLYLIGFQLLFLFGIPEILAPLVIDKPWKFWSVSVPWPLNINALSHTEVHWFIISAFVAFVAVPLYVRRNGERFCSYLCGCGGLAETFGDFWRHLAPRGSTATKLEFSGRIILFLAIPVTLLSLNDLWNLVQSDSLRTTKVFAKNWYSLMVDFWLASVLGVAMYPYLGNRFWCRFFCPLRAYMQIIGKWISRIKITSNDKCIGCGECTKNCQMGIDVQRFAQMREDFSNKNSECIHCGICVEVCPMDVLEVKRDDEIARVK